ncbi:lysophospholipid acyltransferase family protein [Gaiella sp.]|uniref:lysophospholipid acyltransferase family protein n=1 Tax=Gaiella sp. TaxID=2663207 RepID=UPI003982E64B
MSYEAYRRPLTPVVRAAYRLEVRGIKHVPTDGSLVVVANHESILDPFILSASIPRPIRYLAKSELWNVPLLPWWLASVEAIPVERGKSDVAAIAQAIAALEAGEVVGLFPEGGVMRREGPWLRGAARMALATGTPILPVRLLETRRALGSRSFGFPRLAALIGEPISVSRTAPTPELARELTDLLQEVVEELGT